MTQEEWSNAARQMARQSLLWDSPQQKPSSGDLSEGGVVAILIRDPSGSTIDTVRCDWHVVMSENWARHFSGSPVVSVCADLAPAATRTSSHGWSDDAFVSRIRSALPAQGRNRYFVSLDATYPTALRSPASRYVPELEVIRADWQPGQEARTPSLSTASNDPDAIVPSPARMIQIIEEAFAPTTVDLAALLNVSRPTIYKWRGDGGPARRTLNIARLAILADAAEEWKRLTPRQAPLWFIAAPVMGHPLSTWVDRAAMGQVSIRDVVRQVFAGIELASSTAPKVMQVNAVPEQSKLQALVARLVSKEPLQGKKKRRKR